MQQAGDCGVRNGLTKQFKAAAHIRINMATKTKLVTLQVTVKVPIWLTKAETKREVRTLINEECGYLDGKVVNGEYKQLDGIKAIKVESVKFTECLPMQQAGDCGVRNGLTKQFKAAAHKRKRK